ncbi:MAG: hypothetical protein ACI3VN_01305 [Candidatus Onthomonas sp.]
MSNENNSRPASRDELDIDRLIRSIRTAQADSEPEQSVFRKPAPSEAEPAAASGGTTEETPVLHLTQPERPLTRQEREDRDPNVQQMRSQIQSIMAAWGNQPEEVAPVSVQMPEPVPEQEPEQAADWKIPEIVLPPVEEEPERKADVPETWRKAPEEEPKRHRPSLNERLAFLRIRQEEEPERLKLEETWRQTPEEVPEPAEPPENPEKLQQPEQSRREAEDARVLTDLTQPDRVREAERQAFAQGQVVTLRLQRSVPEQAPAEHRIFDQEEDAALEAMLEDNAREYRQRQEAERAAEKREAAERAATEHAAAEQAAAEEEAELSTEPAKPEAESQPAAKEEQRFQMLTVSLGHSEARPELGSAQAFDQERAEEPMERPIDLDREPFGLEHDETPESAAAADPEPEETVWNEPEELPAQPEVPVRETWEEKTKPSKQSFQVLTLNLRHFASKTEGEQDSPRFFDQEQEDEELEAMLAAHAGPAVQPLPLKIVEAQPSEQPEEEPPLAEGPSEQPEPPVSPENEEPPAEEAEAEIAGAPAPETQPEEEPEAAGASTGGQPEEEPDEEPDEEPEEDWDEGIADESLLERPDRGPGLVQRLAALAVGLLQRPKRQKTPADADYEEKEPAQPKRPEKVIELPQEKTNPLQRKLEEVEERANDFADSMFQGDSEEAAEEEKLHRKAERYIPGTDEEREPPRRPKPVREKKPPIRRAPDTSPKELSRIFYSSWKSGKGRLPFQLILSLVLVAFGALAGGELTFIQISELTGNPKLAGILLTAGLMGACALGLDTLLEGIFQLFRGRPGLNTLASIGVAMTLVDGVWFSTLGREGPLPFCGFAALSLWAVAWGNCRKKQGLYLSCQMAAAVSHPQRLTLDQGKWDNKGTFIKETGTAKGFGSQIQEPDGAQQVYQYAAPVMIAACLIFGILAAVGQGGVQQLVWNWSVIFVLATPLSATLAYGVPYTKLVKRLNRSGVILAGWEGADSMKGEAGIAITDSDLFPEGYVQFNGIKNFGQVSLEKLTGCTASVMREMDVGLAKIFDDLIRTQGGFYRRVDDLKAGEGGFSGLIRGDQVLVGNADYMKLMGVPLQQGYQVRNAVFCVINGELQGIFALNYTLAHSIQPALNALIRGGVNPILATRDFNITPTMLRQRFRLPTDRMEYPPMDRRQLLSAKGQPHNGTLGALIYREGLGACTDAILGGRRLRTVVRLNTILAVAASVVGALLGFYLTLMGAYHSLSPLNILFFLVMWLVPILLVSNGVDKF